MCEQASGARRRQPHFVGRKGKEKRKKKKGKEGIENRNEKRKKMEEKKRRVKKDSIMHNHAHTTLNIVGTNPVRNFACRQQKIL